MKLLIFSWYFSFSVSLYLFLCLSISFFLKICGETFNTIFPARKKLASKFYLPPLPPDSLQQGGGEEGEWEKGEGGGVLEQAVITALTQRQAGNNLFEYK